MPRGRKKTLLKGGRRLEEFRKLLDYHGGFHDVASFRAETGATPVEISDDQVRQLIAQDSKATYDNAQKIQQKAEAKAKAADEARQRAEARLQHERMYGTPASVSAVHRQLERAQRNNRLLKNFIDPYYGTDPVIAATQYIRDQKIKDRVKKELAEEKRLKRELSIGRRRRRRSRPRSKSRPRRKSRPRSRSKSRSRSRSKTKRNTKKTTKRRPKKK